MNFTYSILWRNYHLDYITLALIYCIAVLDKPMKIWLSNDVMILPSFLVNGIEIGQNVFT